MRKIIFSLILFFNFCFLFSQNNNVLLWKDVPRMKREKSRLYIFEPADTLKNGISVIVCPGGSYAHSYAIKKEGFEVAKWLNSIGITAFVLQYRVGSHGYHYPAMIEDIQRAIQWVNTHAQNYRINPDLLGVMGFSAGGHLSLMAGVFYKENYLNKWGMPSNINLKPAFVVPVYPVVSMQDSLAHARSRKNLLGRKFRKEKDRFSIELQVTQDMPPVFLVTTKDDPVVSYKNSLVLDSVLKKEEIPHKFLLYNAGGHGFGINELKGGEAAEWKNHFKEWLYEINILKQ